MTSRIAALACASLCGLGLPAAAADALEGKRVLFVLGEREYGTRETIPVFAEERLRPEGVKINFALARSDDRNAIDCHEFDGLESLDDADILFLSVRRRYPKTSDLDRIRAWIESGKPTIAVRTSSHAFGERARGTGYQAPAGHSAWNTFDRDVLGASYQGHYRERDGDAEPKVEMWPEPDMLDHPVLSGFPSGVRYPIDDKLYQYSDPHPDIDILISAQYPGEEEIHPVAWINEIEGKRVFYMSIGGIEEMAMPETQQLLMNAFTWAAATPPVEPRSVNPEKEATSAARAPADSHRSLASAQDLTIDLVASEPEVAQPSFIDFDQRGRMWVVQYRQYPFPAGLKLESRDNYWRNRYDSVPPPPGRAGYVGGDDIITIHEDVDGDGRFEHVKPFLEGMNMVTSLAWDAEGVWVLQPPYLLFYYDRDGDDAPDGPPEVHLSGFGIEDTHSTANSLCWGPDGWLYGAQGSTVTAAIEISGKDDPPLKSIGQLMWRYHPVKREYEVFSEGGGNIWSCEFDSKGRLFAGANEGRKLGYHYMQGSYNRKNFSKHGALSNPYAFGYFNGIEESGSQRVTTNLMVYEESALPARYNGSIMTANPLAGKVLASRKRSTGASFHSDPIDEMLIAEDRWVRPVYLAPGPDGAIYVADWYDRQINHYLNSEGRLSAIDGRIYRIRQRDSQAGSSIDLGKLQSGQLVDYLSDERRWYRETSRRLLRQRQDASIAPRLKRHLREEVGQLALEALWALNDLGEFKGAVRYQALSHRNPWVRLWAVRLLGDERSGSRREYALLAQLAKSDSHIEVRQQLASTAQRLPPKVSAKIIRGLVSRDRDATDPYMPLLIWWALERLCSEEPTLVLDLFAEESVHSYALARDSLLEFTMRRFAAEGSRQSLQYCADLLDTAPEASKIQLLAGLETAFEGRAMEGLPESLVAAISSAGGGSLAMRVRQRDTAGIEEAIQALEGESIGEADRRRLIAALGESLARGDIDILVAQLEREDSATIMVALAALQRFDDPRVGEAAIEAYARFNDNLKIAVRALLASRAGWTRQWLEAISTGRMSKDSVPEYMLPNLRRHSDASIQATIGELWAPKRKIDAEGEQEINRVQRILASATSSGDRYSGRELYISRCAACHQLHSEGGDIGPDLTGYQRQDLGSLLLAISDPAAEVREGFENYIVTTQDGQTISGFLSDQDDNVVVLRPIGGQRLVVRRSDIVSMENVAGSLMPSRLLADLDEKAVIDFFAYLQSTQPLNVQ